MATLFGDSCDLYSATADLLKRWASNTSPSLITFNATGGRNGGGCLALLAGAAGSLTSPNFVGGKNFAHPFWFKCASPPSSTNTLMSISGGFYLLRITTTGTFQFAEANLTAHG